jgi:anti-sigma B factor antagonist
MEGIIRGSVRGELASYRMKGDCDLYSAPRFKADVLKRIDDGVRRIQIDMSEVDYLDSSGVGAIICILKAAKRSGGEVRFRGLAGNPRQVLARTNILGMMDEGAGPIEAAAAV